MGRVGELTDYQSYFASLPTGIFVGAALFALAISVFIVSSIFRNWFERCCFQKKKEAAEVIEIKVNIEDVMRRSFENPSYSQDVKKNHTSTNSEQDINVRISRAGGYLSIENHDYENAAHLKKRQDSEPEIDYVNVKEQNIKPPEVTNNGENYDRPGYPRRKTTKAPAKQVISENENDAPTYDVPKHIDDHDEDEAPDYDVPKSFTG